MNKDGIYKLGRHWVCVGDPLNYDDVYRAVMKTYSKHYVDLLADPVRVKALIWEGRNTSGKAYPEVQEYADKWNAQAHNDRWLSPEDCEALARIIDERTQEGDVITGCGEFAGEILTACEVTGRVALIMRKSAEEFERIKSRWGRAEKTVASD